MFFIFLNLIFVIAEYNLLIYDISKKEMKWNVTFYDYTAKIMPSEKIKNLG